MTATYSESLCAWLHQEDSAKMTTKYVSCMEAKFDTDTWLQELMVGNNCSSKIVERYVSIEELFENRNQEEDDLSMGTTSIGFDDSSIIKTYPISEQIGGLIFSGMNGDDWY